MARSARVVFIICVLLLWFRVPARACSCSEPRPVPCPSFKDLGPIFVGTAITVEKIPDYKIDDERAIPVLHYKFRVVEEINGDLADEVDVYTENGGCGYRFELGKTYLLMSYQGQDKAIFVGMCSGTQSIETAAPLLSELRARRDGNRYASVFGVLVQAQQPYLNTAMEGFDAMLPNSIVELHGSNQTFSARTDSAGVFRFYNLPADTYTFSARLPSNLELAQVISNKPFPAISIPTGACFQNDLSALPTASIRGRVIGPNGAPLGHAEVDLFRVGTYSETKYTWSEFQSRGYFEFRHVTPGEYLLVFNNRNRLDPHASLARTFYPNSRNLRNAKRIVVGPGQQIIKADIHASAKLPTRKVTVKVTGAEYEDFDRIDLRVLGSNRASVIVTQQSPTLFQVTLLQNASYTLYAAQFCRVPREVGTLWPRGTRDSEKSEIGTANTDRAKEITLSLEDRACGEYPRQAQTSP